MKRVKTYDPYMADWGEPDMQESTNGDYVTYYDYMQLYKKYIRARATVAKNKAKAEINKDTATVVATPALCVDLG